jgi:hypothetical protein
MATNLQEVPEAAGSVIDLGTHRPEPHAIIQNK